MPFGGLLTAGISAGGSLLSGIFGKNSADKAAKLQAQAAQKVADMATNASNTAITGVKGATDTGTAAVSAAVPAAIQSVQGGTNEANNTLASVLSKQGDVLNSQQQNVQPYLAAGTSGINTLQSTLQGMLAPGGGLNGNFSFNPTDLQNDPGYKFTLDQGMKALQNSAAAQGSLRSGSTLEGILNYSQGLAGTEYQNAYNRALTTFQTNRSNSLNTLGAINTLAGYGLPAAAQSNAAYGQYGNALQNYGNLSSTNTLNSGYYGGNADLSTSQFLANYGLQGANLAGQFGIQGADIAGRALTGGANAQAAGIVGGNNALWGGVAGATNTLGNYLTMRYPQTSLEMGAPPDPGTFSLPQGAVLPPPSVAPPSNTLGYYTTGGF